MHQGRNAYDVVVVGGGPAGLAAGTTLARARRAVLVVDDDRPRNAPANGVHNYLGREGVPPRELLATGRSELEGYGGTVRAGRALAARSAPGGIEVDVAGPDGDGAVETVHARRLVIAGGVEDGLPAVPGLAERWGAQVLHCPYCHGWEVRDRDVAVLATSAGALHQAQMLRQWTPHVTVVVHEGPTPTEAQLAELTARGIGVLAGPVDSVEDAPGGRVVLRLPGGATRVVDAVAVAPYATARSEVLASLDLPLVEQQVGGFALGRAVDADPSGATAVPGVFVAGNVADLRATAISSAASGMAVAVAVNAELVAEDVARAVTAGTGTRRGGGHSHDEVTEGASFWDAFYAESDRIWSGRPNPVLVEVALPLAPGRALDLGAGEGGDAVWLAAQGWRVTALDIAEGALERVRDRAGAEGLTVETVRCDLAEGPPTGSWDLVSAQYLHSPAADFPREKVLRAAADAVAPGGVLLVVGHGRLAPWQGGHGHVEMPTAAEVLDQLDLAPGEWTAERVESRERLVSGGEGHPPVAITDEILVLARAM